MLAKVYSFGLWGIEAYPIEIEVDISLGLPAISLVGLPDTAIKESKDRLKPAIKNSGFHWPSERITVNLAPSDIKKEGACFDLPIALGVLAASGQLDQAKLNEYVILGELSLDGQARPIKGVLPVVIAMSKLKKQKIILPFENAKEAAIVSNRLIYPVKTLAQAVQLITESDFIKPFRLNLNALLASAANYEIDFSEVKGQSLARRAIEVAVSGNHNILLIGPPGSGKTMLAKRIPTIMPDLDLEELLEITKIHSVAGTLPTKQGILNTRPFRQVHQTISEAALIGGSSHPHPGEISLAHKGVLFLDELPEFHRDVLEALRQPLEDGYIRVSRAKNSLLFPSSFMLVAAMNPCPCGYFTDPRKACRCNPNKIASYMGKISGPLLDRIDIHIELPSIKYRELTDTREAESSSIIKARAEKTRAVQRERFKLDGISYNAQMNTRLIRKYCVLENTAKELLKMAMTELGLSARAYDKILKLSRTIADLAESETIRAEHLSEAIQYRSLDRQW
jgi:magnesium chelatase family protein